MTDPTTRRADVDRANAPAMPRLAAQCAHELSRPAKSVYDGLRAIEAWFLQHGDPFIPLDPSAFINAVTGHRDALNPASETHSNAELVARLWSAFSELNARLEQAARREG
jgi:hypothetical protein